MYFYINADFELYLSGGIARREGLLLVRYGHDYRWGTVCSDGWGQEETDVVCHQLGYSSGKELMGLEDNHFGQSPGERKETSVLCNMYFFMLA